MQPFESVMPWLLGPNYPKWREILPGGCPILIRPECKQDAEAEREFIASLSPQTRRLRFLGQVRRETNKTLNPLTDLDYERDVALAAVVTDGEKDRFVGVSRYAASSNGT